MIGVDKQALWGNLEFTTIEKHTVGKLNSIELELTKTRIKLDLR
jgi:hypothetical protein